jgi:hypothetical protein
MPGVRKTIINGKRRKVPSDSDILVPGYKYPKKQKKQAEVQRNKKK